LRTPKKFIERLARKILRKPEVNYDAERVRRGTIVFNAKDSAFYNLLMDEIAGLHKQFLQSSEESLWQAGGAASLLLLTERLEGYISARDAILAREEEERRRQEAGETKREPVFINDGESPHTI
jgi:hypothetical protein